MKTPEQWMNQFGKFPNDNKQEDEIYKLAKLPENLLPKVNFWNSVVTETDIEQIQSDARQELEQENTQLKGRIKLLSTVFDFAFLERDMLYEIHGYDQKLHCIWCGGIKPNHHEKCELHNNILKLTELRQSDAAINATIKEEGK